MKAKTATKILLTMMFSFAMLFLFVGDVSAKEAKTSTYVLDAKSGVGYQTAFRATANDRFNSTTILLPTNDCTVSVKATGGVVAKVTYTSQMIGENTFTSNSNITDKEGKEIPFKGAASISVFSTKDGTYDLNVTVKRGKKQLTKKKIKVIFGYTTMIEKMSYAGKQILFSNLVTSKGSGKFSVKVGKDFALKKIEYGGYDANGEVQYKTTKNNKKITLSGQKNFSKIDYSYGFDDPDSNYGYESGQDVTYIYPVTFVRITVLDKKLGVVETSVIELFKK
ncbi:MAG: hypothetical protein K6E18_09550 [Lachnospiraceae bacterium]|nr:hypothetical protein [Lachnospiraceae bacterium]